MIEWEVRTSGEHRDSGTCESPAAAWNEAFDTASHLLDRSAHDQLTIEVQGQEVYVLPGNLWPEEAANIDATRAVLESLRSDIVIACT